MNGLTAGTTYDFVVRSLCGPGGNGPSATATVSGKTTGGNTSTPVTVDLNPVDDAYIQASNNSTINNNVLYVDGTNRVSYLKFDVSAISGTIASASLKLTGSTDSGNGVIDVNLGTNSNWTETNLTSANAPGKGVALGNINGPFSKDTVKDIALTGVTKNGNFLTLIVSQANGADANFSSSEAATGKPVLTITYNSTTGAKDELNANLIKAFPNPVHNVLNLSGLSEKSLITIIDLRGQTILKERTSASKNAQLDVSQLPKGMYFVQVQNGTSNFNLKILKD
ncbi:T9SS C-terminal target domain-containing protein [Aquimarina sp. AD10]|nr:T9SS C-terminal target domain-containing protein [Aquimarina sp. AD10]RKN00257.1 DNRLRE domain-containing protein [Aquimarina sp. AD10]